MSTSPFQRHLARLRSPPRAVRVDRPCTLGDGIGALDHPDPGPLDAPITLFIPASGAASRLFQPLFDLDPERFADLPSLLGRAARDPHLRDAAALLSAWSDLPIAAACGLPAPGPDLPGWLRALRDAPCVGLPKALLPFHRVDGEPSTPVRAHLAEALRLTSAPITVHLTASPDLHQALLAHAEQIAAGLTGGERLRIRVSDQDPATNLPAVELDGRPVRDGERYLCRPGGHGALLDNLASEHGIVLIRNVDNAPHPRHLDALVPLRRQLARAALTLDATRREHLAAVRASPDRAGAARAWLAESFGLAGSPEPAAVLADLDRPLRLCGVVPNQGQPGGGPFWAPGPDGRITPQIVESVEIDRDEPAQTALLAASTHFNPVDLVCLPHNARGEPVTLGAHTDPERWIVTTKVHDGRPIRCLEHPGLWNGGMAGWLTRFVELPPLAFSPVKTLTDLLSPAHRPEDA